MRTALAILIGLLLLLSLAGGQDKAAAQLPPDYEQAPAVALPPSLERTAAAYWEAPALALPGPPLVQMLPQGNPAILGAGTIGSARVWLHPTLPPLVNSSVYWQAILCTTYVHERGHNAGLGHAGDRIMAATLKWIPPKCWRWAERKRYAY